MVLGRWFKVLESSGSLLSSWPSVLLRRAWKVSLGNGGSLLPACSERECPSQTACGLESM